jgi:hypothetical protein
VIAETSHRNAKGGSVELRNPRADCDDNLRNGRNIFDIRELILKNIIFYFHFIVKILKIQTVLIVWRSGFRGQVAHLSRNAQSENFSEDKMKIIYKG